MITNVPKVQSVIRVFDDELQVNNELYPMSDVLYADVVDSNNNPTHDYFRRVDWLIISGVSAVTILVLGSISLVLLFNVGRNFLWIIWPVAFVIRALNGKIKNAQLERSRDRVTLRVHTRRDSVELLQSESLLQAQMTAAKINRAVKREMVG